MKQSLVGFLFLSLATTNVVAQQSGTTKVAVPSKPVQQFKKSSRKSRDEMKFSPITPDHTDFEKSLYSSSNNQMTFKLGKQRKGLKDSQKSFVIAPVI